MSKGNLAVLLGVLERKGSDMGSGSVGFHNYMKLPSMRDCCTRKDSVPAEFALAWPAPVGAASSGFVVAELGLETSGGGKTF